MLKRLCWKSFCLYSPDTASQNNVAMPKLHSQAKSASNFSNSTSIIILRSPRKYYGFCVLLFRGFLAQKLSSKCRSLCNAHVARQTFRLWNCLMLRSLTTQKRYISPILPNRNCSLQMFCLLLGLHCSLDLILIHSIDQVGYSFWPLNENKKQVRILR